MSETKRRYEALKPEQRLGDAPIEERHYAQMEQLERALDEIFNGDKHGQDRAVGFVLMVFPFGDRSGRCNFAASNGADRHDVVTLMREMIARFEGQQRRKGGHDGR